MLNLGAVLRTRALALRAEPSYTVSALRASIASAWRRLVRFVASLFEDKWEPRPPYVPLAEERQEPLDGLERVHCKCRAYHGTDFWNDPHRWCGVDPAHEAFWMKAGPRDCERTWRPTKVEALPAADALAQAEWDITLYAQQSALQGLAHYQQGLQGQLMGNYMGSQVSGSGLLYGVFYP
jgi:hypothetical protein